MATIKQKVLDFYLSRLHKSKSFVVNQLAKKKIPKVYWYKVLAKFESTKGLVAPQKVRQ